MNRVYYSIAQVIVLVVVMLFSASTARSEITIQDVQTTDVTPSGFAVTWQTSEPAMPGIAVFSDVAGTNEITRELEISLFPMYGGDPEIIDEYQMDEEMDNLRDHAKSLGLMKIGIHGCIPDTTYYYRVHVEAGSETASWPAGDPLPVTTTRENSFVSDSKQLLVTLVDSEGTLNAAGWMVTASAGEAIFPISAFVGDGAGANQAYLNLSQLFGADGLSWTPTGTKEISLEIKGSEFGPIEHTLSLDFSDNFYVSTVYPVEINAGEPQDSDGDGLSNFLENSWCTNLFDADSDDDGIPDGDEDANHNGVVDEGETDPCNVDTDGDGIQDGTELGITEPVVDPDGDGHLLGTDTDVFIPDADPNTTTNPLNADSDGDGAWDGTEDANHNGRVDAGETDPSDASSNPEALIHLKKGFNLVAIPADVSSMSDLRDWLPIFGDSSEIEKVMVYDEVNNRFVTLIPEDGSNPSFTLQGGEGLIVYAKKEKQVGFVSVYCSSLDLEPGFNLIGIACPADEYSAFDLLGSLGSENVSSVQRYSTEKGAFETAGFGPEDQLVGVDFLIVAGEGYFIYRK
jgi:hypothetical protein